MGVKELMSYAWRDMDRQTVPYLLEIAPRRILNYSTHPYTNSGEYFMTNQRTSNEVINARRILMLIAIEVSDRFIHAASLMDSQSTYTRVPSLTDNH